MTISDRLTKLSEDITSAYKSINDLGGTIPAHKNTENISVAIDSIYNRLPKVSGTGSDITLTPTLKGRLSSVINGDTLQDGTPTPSTPVKIQSVEGIQNETVSGKNLFDKDDVTNGALDGDGTLIANNYYCTSNYIPVIPNTTYYKTATNSARFKYYDINKNRLSNVYNDIPNAGNAQAFTTPNNAYYIRLSIDQTNGTSVYVDTLQIEKGSTATSYQPYQTPQTQEINLRGKNLLENKLNSTTINGITATVNEDKSITFNRSATTNTAFVLTGNTTWNGITPVIELEPGTYKLTTPDLTHYGIQTRGYTESNSTIRNLFSSNNNPVETFTEKAYITHCQILMLANVENVNYTIYPQIELGSTSTSYVPYREPIKLYNGDYITGTPDNWGVVRENGEIILDGSEDWMQNTVYNNVYYVENFLTDATTIEPREMISDYFTYGGLLTTGSGSVEINKFYQWTNLPQRIILGFDTTNLATFKTWLSTHNTKVVYPLATPTTTPITDTNLISQLNALYNAKSYDGQTNISVSGNLPMILDVSALKGA